jgi:hypothetical protein
LKKNQDEHLEDIKIEFQEFDEVVILMLDGDYSNNMQLIILDMPIDLDFTQNNGEYKN